MFILKNFNRHLSIGIAVRLEAEQRISEKRFKGKSVPVAGNFSRWGSLYELMRDVKALSSLCAELENAYNVSEFGTHSFEVEFEDFIGWSNTDDLEIYNEDDLEEFNPNRKSVGYRVRMDRTRIKAPKTKVVTFVYEFRDEPALPVAVIHSIYPGNDIGEVRGEISKDLSIVFFDYNHPGVE